MKGRLQVVPEPQHAAYQMVVHHTQREDFSIYQPAGFALRWYALTLDVALSAPLDVLVHLPFNRYLERLSAYGHEGRHIGVAALLAMIPLFGYFIVPTLLWGQTLGKKIVGIRVVRKNCDPRLGVGAVLLRETIGKFLSLALFGAGFFMVALGQRKRALHDLLAGTVVLSYRER